AFYFSVVTLTTIGFGDYVPETPTAKLIVSLLCMIGVPIFGNTMAELVALLYGERQRHVKRRLPALTVPGLLQLRQFAKELDMSKLRGAPAEEDLSAAGERRISKFEFCCFLLVQNGIIGMEDVESISKSL
ncbi:unnamed protein product, partial [Effrenium voratum]